MPTKNLRSTAQVPREGGEVASGDGTALNGLVLREVEAVLHQHVVKMGMVKPLVSICLADV